MIQQHGAVPGASTQVSDGPRSAPVVFLAGDTPAQDVIRLIRQARRAPSSVPPQIYAALPDLQAVRRLYAALRREELTEFFAPFVGEPPAIAARLEPVVVWSPTAGAAAGRSTGLPADRFERLRQALQTGYLLSDAPFDPFNDEIVQQTLRAVPIPLAPRFNRLNRPLNDVEARLRSGRASWPYAAPETTLPPTLPDGSPWPRISIITPSYNQGRYIEQTLLSVRHQGYLNVEHIVMDGGSTDETLSVLERHREHLAHVTSGRDNGQSDAINRGMQLATGEILTWLNSDDLLAPGALASVALALWCSKADMAAGVCQIHRDLEVFEEHLTACADGQPLPLEELLDIDQCWMGGKFFYQPEVMFRRELWERAGGRVDVSLRYSMDYELWLRFAEAGARLTVLGRPVAMFRVHDEQKTHVQAAFEAELAEVRARFLSARQRNTATALPRDRGRQALRIAMFNDVGYLAGAGIAHKRLAEACALAGHSVYPLAVTDGQTLDRTQPVTSQLVLQTLEPIQPDLVLVGNLHAAALDASVLGAIADRWPAAMVLHDQWALTGRCAYTGPCTRYKTGCDSACPTPDEYPSLDPERIHAAWSTKRALHASDRSPLLLANSRWMENFCRSALEADPRTRAKLQPLQLGAPLEVFRPRDPAVCREMLGLPQDRFIILLSASPIHDPRKGAAHLDAALEQLGLPDVEVVCAGWVDPSAPPPVRGLRALGYVRDPQRLAMLYSAADLFVGPSLAEAFGQVFVEAAACGTPSIGYPVGGVPEAIIHGVTGLVAERVDPLALAEAILELYANRERRRAMGAWARLYAENCFSIRREYHSLFVALDAAGVRESLNLRRKIRFVPSGSEVRPLRYVDLVYPRWRAVSGFQDWEGPFPEQGLPRCRWVHGPIARLEVNVGAAGVYTVLLNCRNYWAGQRIRLRRGEVTAGELDLPVTGSERPHVLSFQLELRAGVNELTIESWQWDTTKSVPIAFQVTDISFVPAPAI